MARGPNRRTRLSMTVGTARRPPTKSATAMTRVIPVTSDGRPGQTDGSAPATIQMTKPVAVQTPSCVTKAAESSTGLGS